MNLGGTQEKTKRECFDFTGATASKTQFQDQELLSEGDFSIWEDEAQSEG